MIKVEEGKYYKTRDGRKVGPMKFGTKNWWMTDGIGGTSDFYYTQHNPQYAAFSGKSSAMRNNEPAADDLIEEWKDEQMPKFKVGDRVKWNNPGLEVGAWQDFLITEVNEKCTTYTGTDSVNGFGGFSFHWDLSLVEETPKSPVRERMVKEIVPGVYGRIEVDGRFGSIINFRMLSVSGNKSNIYGFTVKDLRNAAIVFNQLADALEDDE